MPKSSPIYTNLNTGELSLLASGRSDLEQYNKGGLDYKNLMALFYGPAMMRPGSVYSADTKVHAETSRLLEFVFSPTDAQIILMGDSYFRFFTSLGQVIVSAAPLEVAHTYTEDELFNVHYVQSNDVITLNHGDHKPAKLTRVTASSWSLADYDFKGNPYLPDNTVAADLLTCSVNTEGDTGTLTATGGHTPFAAGHIGTFWKFSEPTGSPLKQGYLKITGHTSSTVVDIEVIGADLSVAGGTPTKEWAEAAWSSVRGWPARCWYSQNRLVFARTTTQPNGYWRSKPFIYDNFDRGTGLDNDAISELVPGASDIKWIREELIGTDVGDFVVSSGDASHVVTPESISIKQNTNTGSEAIQPKLIGNYTYPVQLKSRKLREVSYLFQEDSYKSADTTVLSEHITESGIKDTAYQRNPYSIHPCVLNNGKMAVMTRESDQAVLGWTPWDTDGEYESTGVIPHPTEPHDMIFTITKREIEGVDKRFVEYFESPIIPDRQEMCFYVDSGLRFSAYEQTTSNSLTLSAVTGEGIAVTAGSSVFVAGDVGQRIRAIDVDDGTILGELTITQHNSGTEVLGDVDFDFSTTSYSGNAWGISVNDISGLDHLEAKTVKLLVDGGTNDDKTVASGSITLADGDDGFIIAVGLGYTGRWKNMPIEAGSATGTSQGKKKRIYQCGFKFYRSLGMQVGGDEDHLKDLVLRDPETLFGQPEPLITGTVPPQMIDSTWDYEGHIVIEQSTPLPMCILAVMPLLQTNDK